MIIIALFAALMCIFAPMTLPLGPVPLTLATFIVYIAVGLLGVKSVYSVILYIFIGAVGLPVFSYGTGGFEKLIGPTGGYITGYILCAIIAGLISRQFYKSCVITAVGFFVGTVMLYLFGTIWFSIYTGSDFIASLYACAFVFIPLDILKIICAIVLVKVIRKRIDTSKYF